MHTVFAVLAATWPAVASCWRRFIWTTWPGIMAQKQSLWSFCACEPLHRSTACLQSSALLPHGSAQLSMYEAVSGAMGLMHMLHDTDLVRDSMQKWNLLGIEFSVRTYHTLCKSDSDIDIGIVVPFMLAIT